MGPQIQILILEDNEADAERIERELGKTGLDFKGECVRDKDAFLQALDRFTPDLILADDSVPGFDGRAALALVRKRSREVPVVVIADAGGEELAVEALKAGAADYVLKRRMTRLGPAVRRALQEAERLKEQRRTEREALQAQREWERIFDAVPDLIFVLDERHRILRVNRAAAERLGTAPDRCVGRFCYEVIHGLDQPPDFCPHALTLADGREHAAEMREARLGGEFLVTTTPLADERGVRIGSVHVVRDIAERQRAEEALRQSESRYRSLFEGMTEGFALHEILCDEKGAPRDYRFLEINPAFERLMGLKRENVIGKTAREILPGTEPPWIEQFGRVALSGEPVHFESYAAALGKHYEIHAYSPAPRRFGVLFLDITERQRAEEALRRAKDELETRVRERTEELTKSQKRLQQLSSHLLRAQEAERKRVAVEVHDGLLSELAAMKFLVDRRLALLDQGKPWDLNEFKKLAAILTAVMSEARGIMNNLHPSILDDLGLIATLHWLSGEYEKSYPHLKVRTRIEVPEQEIAASLKPVIFRVAQEALNNFAKHGKGDRADLAITKSGGVLALRVRDNGQGFDAENAPKGLGLESMRERVQMSGGEFQVESAPGRGTAIRAVWDLS